VHVQIAEVGISLWVGVNPSIDNGVVCSKQRLRESRTSLILIRQITTTTSGKQHPRERDTG
jgi:hypothetical protein